MGDFAADSVGLAFSAVMPQLAMRSYPGWRSLPSRRRKHARPPASLTVKAIPILCPEVKKEKFKFNSLFRADCTCKYVLSADWATVGTACVPKARP